MGWQLMQPYTTTMPQPETTSSTIAPQVMNRAARICEVARSGQVLASATALETAEAVAAVAALGMAGARLQLHRSGRIRRDGPALDLDFAAQGPSPSKPGRGQRGGSSAQQQQQVVEQERRWVLPPQLPPARASGRAPGAHGTRTAHAPSSKAHGPPSRPGPVQVCAVRAPAVQLQAAQVLAVQEQAGVQGPPPTQKHWALEGLLPPALPGSAPEEVEAAAAVASGFSSSSGPLTATPAGQPDPPSSSRFAALNPAAVVAEAGSSSSSGHINHIGYPGATTSHPNPTFSPGPINSQPSAALSPATLDGTTYTAPASATAAAEILEPVRSQSPPPAPAVPPTFKLFMSPKRTPPLLPLPLTELGPMLEPQSSCEPPSPRPAVLPRAQTAYRKDTVGSPSPLFPGAMQAQGRREALGGKGGLLPARPARAMSADPDTLRALAARSLHKRVDGFSSSSSSGGEDGSSSGTDGREDMGPRGPGGGAGSGAMQAMQAQPPWSEEEEEAAGLLAGKHLLSRAKWGGARSIVCLGQGRFSLKGVAEEMELAVCEYERMYD